MTTATDEAAFIRAICANPGDDTARLVYADWLEEHAGACDLGLCVNGIRDLPNENNPPCWKCGGTGRNGNAERAEFIRVQCELAKPVPTVVVYRGWAFRPIWPMPSTSVTFR